MYFVIIPNLSYGPRHEKTYLRGFQPGQTQTSLLSYRDLLKIEISLVASLDMILYKERLTMALIRLQGCAGWSAPLLFANTEDRFSRVEAHMMSRLKMN